ncbi:MAG: hypothetical protein RL291_1726 [Pseudomonadota bacterium]
MPTAMYAALPVNHPLRLDLNNEVHARPPEALKPPQLITYVACISSADQSARDWQHLAELARHFGATFPTEPRSHISIDVGPIRLAYERHSEFARYAFIARCNEAQPFKAAPLPELPDGWIKGLGGQLLIATRIALIADRPALHDLDAVAQEHFAGNTLIGSVIGGETARAYTDLRIHADGYSRFLVVDKSMSPRQAGRMVQRLFEVDSYRMMALLGLPEARRLWPILSGFERDLEAIIAEVAKAEPSRHEATLDRLIALEAAVQQQYTATHYRFSASAAYHDLVGRRIDELREDRIEGLQTLREFTDRRLAPAMSTCRTVAGNLDALSQRIARTTQLLSTQVEVSREQQNRALLESMARRSKLQLRLQQTVEGLSVAAITYYIVGLVAYAAKGISSITPYKFNADLAAGLSIPIIIAFVTYGIRSLRRRLHTEDKD